MKVRNSKPVRRKRRNPLRLDPSRTATLRRAFVAQLRRRFKLLKGRLVQLILREDALGLTANVFCPTGEGGGVDPSCGGEVSAKEALAAVSALPKVKFQGTDTKGSRGPYVAVPLETDLTEGLLDKVREGLARGKPKKEIVAISSLVALQNAVSKKSLEHMVKNFETADYLREPVVVVQMGGKSYLYDGTHRASAAKLLGKETIQASVYKVRGKLTRNERDSIEGSPETVYYETGGEPYLLHNVTEKNALRLTDLIENVFCPTGEGGGVDASCAPNSPNAPQSPTTILQKMGKAGAWLKAKTKTLYDKLEKRYGRKTAIAIFVAGHAVGLATPLVVLPGSTLLGMAPFAAVAEVIKQAKRLVGNAEEQLRDEHGRWVKALTQTEAIRESLRHHGYHNPIGLESDDYLVRKAVEGGVKGGPRGAVEALRGADMHPDIAQKIVDHAEKIKRESFEHTENQASNTLPESALEELLADLRALTKQMRTLFPEVTANTRWAFSQDADKVTAFQQWLQQQTDQLLTGADSERLWERYAEQGFAKGAGRVFDDLRQSEKYQATSQEQLDFYAGSRDQFLRSSFSRPESVEKIKLLAGRSFDELEGVTDAMGLKMSRVLTDGLTEGANPREMARDLTKEVDLALGRAETVARTEIIRVHAEGQLEAFAAMGVEEIGVAVEFSDADDDDVCPECEALNGVVLRVDEAHGLIPVHPRCRCCFTPANVGEDDEGQKRSKGEIDRAAEAADVELDISPGRPRSILNSFSEWVVNCNVGQIRGADGRCGPGKPGASIPRDEMPQIKSEDLTDFLAYARQRGVKVTPQVYRAEELRPTQAEFRQERVDAIPQEKLTDPILASMDGYVLDGTHRWIKHWQGDPWALVPVLEIGLALEGALGLMREFPKAVFAANANPDQPRDEHGRFASGLHANLDAAVGKTSNLTDEQRTEYKASLHAIFHKMTPKALERCGAAVRQAQFHPSLHALTEALAANSQKVQDALARGKIAGGAYNPGTGRLTLDGGGLVMDTATGQSKATTAGLHAHELGHALDYGRDPLHPLSSKPEWQEAWRAELTDGRISKYAGRDAREGFAEFSRLVHGTKLTADKISTAFPRCAAVWKAEGLL